MSSFINTNVTAMQAAQNLDINNNNLSGDIEQLSSGLRINSAADDPAGAAISENFKAQISGLNQATSNANDAINEVKTAEGALSQVQSLLVSMRQLAVQASNLGTNSSIDLQADQTQINSAIASINQISSTTSYGNVHLLNGSANSTATGTAGTVASTGGVNIVANGTYNAADAGSYGTVSITAATAATDSYSFDLGSTPGTYLGSAASASGVYSGSVIINGSQYNLATAAASSLTGLNQAIASSGYLASVDNSTGRILFTSEATGQLASPAAINVADLTIGTSNLIAGTSSALAATATALTLTGATAATLSATLTNDTVGTAGTFVYAVNGGSNQTISLGTTNTLNDLSTSLAAEGITLAVASGNVTLTGNANLSVVSSSAVIGNKAESITLTPGASASQTVTAAATNGTLSATLANDVAETAGSITVGVAASSQVITIAAGENLSAVNAAITVGGALSVVGGNLSFIDSGSSVTLAGSAIPNFSVNTTLSAATGTAGVAGGVSYAAAGVPASGNTLTSAQAIFSGILTISGGTGQSTFTIAPGTNLTSLNSTLAAAGAAASVTSSGSLAFYNTVAAAAPTVTLGSNFTASNQLTATTTGGNFTNGTNQIMTLSNVSSTLTSTSTQTVGSTNYYQFANGLVTSSTAGAGSVVGNLTATAGTDTVGQALEFQIGANGGQTTSIAIGSTAANLLGTGAASYVDANGTTQTVETDSVADLNVLTFKGAQDAVAVIDQAISQLSTAQANLGSFQTNVLQSTVNSLGTASTNLSSSLSTIEDSDLSTEIVNYTKNQVLVQAGVSALSYANQAPQSILKLLQ